MYQYSAEMLKVWHSFLAAYNIVCVAGVWVCTHTMIKDLLSKVKLQNLDNSQCNFIVNNGEIKGTQGTWLDEAKCCQHVLK